MKYTVSTMDRSDIDEALYLLAAVSAPSLSQYEANVQRQGQEFKEAQEQQRLHYENEERRRLQEHKEAVQQQEESYASAQRQHEEQCRQVQKRRLLFYGAGGVAVLIAVVGFVMGRGGMRGPLLDPLWLGLGVVGLALIAAGVFTKEPPPPLAPKALAPPAPLPVPAPLPMPDPIAMPALPHLAKLYWRLILTPFDNEQWLLIDPQMAQPHALYLPEQDLSAATTLASEQSALSEADVIRTLHKMHQLLTVDLNAQKLYLATNDSPLAPVVTSFLAQSPVMHTNGALDAPTLPGAEEAQLEAMQQAMSRVRAFVDRPFGVEQDGTETIFQNVLTWVDRAILSLQTNSDNLLAQGGAEQVAKLPASNLLENSQQSCQRLFDQVSTDLLAEENDLIHQAQGQVDEKKHGITQNMEDMRRRIEKELAAVVQGLDDQIAESQRRRLTVVINQEQSQSKLDQENQRLATMEEKSIQARADAQTAANEATRLADAHQEAEKQLLSKSSEIDSLLTQLQSAPTSAEQLALDIADLNQQISAEQGVLELANSHAETIATKLASDEQQLQTAMGASGMSTRVVDSMRAGVEKTRQELIPAQDAVRDSESKLTLLQNNLLPLQQELENQQQMAVRLAEMQAQKGKLDTEVEQLADDHNEQQRIVDSKMTDAQNSEGEFAVAQQEDKIAQFERDVQLHGEAITEINGELAKTSDAKAVQQSEADKKLAELKQQRTSEFQQLDNTLAEQLAQIAKPRQEVLARRDAFLNMEMTVDNHLYNQQVEKAIITFREEALSHEQEEISREIEKLNHLIAQARGGYSSLLWTLPAGATPSSATRSSATPSTSATVEYFLPIWFARQGDNGAWNVVAAGRTFSALPINDKQSVHAQQLPEMQPWLESLAQGEVASRYQALLEKQKQPREAASLKKQLDSLVSQQMIDSHMGAYLEQMFTEEVARMNDDSSN